MNGMKPEFLKGKKLDISYYSMPDPCKNVPSCNVNLLELSRYARNNGKKLIELTNEEIQKFAIK